MHKMKKLLGTSLLTVVAASAIFSQINVANENQKMNHTFNTKQQSSDNYNAALGLQLSASVDKPMVSLIDVRSKKIVATVGDSFIDYPAGYGGSKATGEPFWFSEDKFALIDRGNNTIELFQVKKRVGEDDKWDVTFLDIVETPSAVERFVHRDMSGVQGEARLSYYAIAEGAADKGLAPSVLKYVLQGDTLTFAGEIDLSVAGITEIETHRVDIRPNGKEMYVASNEGKIYVINTEKMEVTGTRMNGATAL